MLAKLSLIIWSTVLVIIVGISSAAYLLHGTAELIMFLGWAAFCTAISTAIMNIFGSFSR